MPVLRGAAGGPGDDGDPGGAGTAHRFRRHRGRIRSAPRDRPDAPARIADDRSESGSDRAPCGARSGKPTPMADGFLPVQSKPETGVADQLRSIRSAARRAWRWSRQSASSRWIFGVLVPEYCIQTMADTARWGPRCMGMLFVLIAVMPVVFLGPLLLSYWLQYLGRVLVSSAMGECAPAPDARPQLRRLPQRPESLVHLAGPRPGPRLVAGVCAGLPGGPDGGVPWLRGGAGRRGVALHPGGAHAELPPRRRLGGRCRGACSSASSGSAQRS